MKINKKVLIPVFATAMGLSVIGGVSGAVAWYQYNTKVQASWMGVTSADGGVLQIKKVEDGAKWDRFANFGSTTSKLHPITFGALTGSEALPSKAYKHPHAGVTDMTKWDEAVKGTDYYEMKFELRALKLNESTGAYDACAANVHLEELVLDNGTDTPPEVVNAVRVHISDGTTNKLYSKAGGTIDTNGKLNLDHGEGNDIQGGYGWNYVNTELTYGAGTQTSSTLTASTTLDDSNKLFVVPEAGLTVTVTIWLEGWQQLEGSAIWDSTKASGVDIHFGMKLATPKTTFVAD